MKSIIAFALFVSPFFVFAQEATTTANTATTPVVDSGVTVASVNLTNAQLIKLSTSTYSVSFSLSAEKGKQDNVRYDILLADDDGTHAATYAFDKSLSLQAGSSTLVTEEITTPKGLSGKFAIIVRALTENGLPLGSGIAGTIDLKDTELVKLVSCDANKDSYAKTETLEVTCTVKEVKKGALASLPEGNGYIVKGGAFYENSPKEAEGAIAEIVNGKAMLAFKNLKDPGNYAIYATLAERSGPSVGRELDTLFTVKGVKVSILNTQLDKDAYKTGETALATLSLKVVASGVTPLLTLTTSLSGKSGACSNSASREPSSGAIQVMLPIKTDCVNPTLSVTVTNPDNLVLASSTLSLTSKIIEPVIKNPEPSTNPKDKMIYGGTGALGLLFGLLAVFIARKKTALVATQVTTSN